MMRDLKIQEATLLLKKILADPKTYNLEINERGIIGKDDKISFVFVKEGERGSLEVKIDGLTFVNKTGEWHNAIIMLENTIKKIEKESENQRVSDAMNKLKEYLSE